MTQPARGYQPYQPMAPMMAAPTPPKQSRGGLTTLLAGVLALVVAGLAVGGSFGSITDYRNSYEIDGDPSVYATSTTWWGFADSGSSSPVEEESILAGLTLVLAATLLVLGAVFAFVAARTRTFGPVSGARSLMSAGVGVLVGVTVLQLLAVVKQVETYNDQELDAGESLEFTPGLGLWLPLGGVVLGVVAVVLAHIGPRPREMRVEPNTPRMGFPAPYGYRPQAPVAERVTEVQISDEDAAADTQVVSEATVSKADAPAGQAQQPATPAAPAPVAPPAPVTPPAPVAPPVTPATTSMPEQPTSPTVGSPQQPTPPADSAPDSSPAGASPEPTPAEPPAAPAGTASTDTASTDTAPADATPADTAPAADATPGEPEAAPAEKPGEPEAPSTSSADAPPAPPAPGTEK